MKRIVFNDSLLQSQFDDIGYVKIPFLDEAEVEELLSFYHHNESGLGGGYHSSMFSKSSDFRAKAHQQISKIIKDKVERVLDKHKIVICTYLVKDPGNMSRVGLHCDWSLTDESQYQSIILWIPLCDVHHDNGAMYMLDGSHRDTNSIRGEGIEVPYDKIPDDFVLQNMTLVPVKKGDAVIFDLSVLHCSFPNETLHPRIAFNVGLIPEEAPSLHYYIDEQTAQGKYDIYKAEGDFYFKNTIGIRPPQSAYLESKDFRFDGLSPQELMEKYTKENV
ncbi:MAG: phytanoyl-CoA dioxygenase family protein [Chitinophagales bacterium]|nr:phytanoyl-CoA dioxygenase family protein [Chitinophagales bacterium]